MPKARMMDTGMVSWPIEKFTSDRAVCAPYSLHLFMNIKRKLSGRYHQYGARTAPDFHAKQPIKHLLHDCVQHDGPHHEERHQNDEQLINAYISAKH